MAHFFSIFHALSFEINFFFDRRFPLSVQICIAVCGVIFASDNYYRMTYADCRTTESLCGVTKL